MEIVEFAIFIVVLIVSVSTHEAMHAYTSNYLGDDTARLMGRLTLNPIKHIDVFSTILLPILLFLSGLPVFGAAKPVVFNANKVKHEENGIALIAIAGPLTNLVLAIIAGLTLRFAPITIAEVQFFLLLTLQVNLGFFVFNLIPFPPLDGSRLLYAISPDPIRDVLHSIERFGIAGVFIFIVIFYGTISEFIGSAILAIARVILGS